MQSIYLVRNVASQRRIMRLDEKNKLLLEAQGRRRDWTKEKDWRPRLLNGKTGTRGRKDRDACVSTQIECNSIMTDQKTIAHTDTLLSSLANHEPWLYLWA